MPVTSYDFAIFGSTATASLLAGMLARIGGKRVLRVGARASAQRLQRRLDLALPLVTRPRTWDVLLRGEAEIRTLVRTIGVPDALAPVDVRIHADTEASRAFFGHLAHVALAAGLGVTAKGNDTVLRGVPMLRVERAEDKIEEWLAAGGVRSFDPQEIRADFRRSGVSLSGPSGDIDAGQVVLADEAALLELPSEMRTDSLRAEELTTTMIGRVKPLATRVQLYMDRGVSLLQRDDGSVMALVSGGTEIDARLASAFTGPFPIARTATGRTHHLVSIDGAPVIGKLRRSGIFVTAGLGHAAAFFAPTLARHLAGVAIDPEDDWVAAHDPSVSRETISEAIG